MPAAPSSLPPVPVGGTISPERALLAVVPGDTFGARLRRYRLRAELRLVELARLSGHNRCHLSQVETGYDPPPERATVIRIAAPLGLSAAELDELLAAAGHLPARWQKLGPRDPTLEAVLDVLTDDSLPPADRARFRGLVEAAACAVGRPPC